MADSLVRIQTVGSTLVEPVAPQDGHRQQPKSVDADGLTFSRHLNDRLNRRNLELDEEKMTRLSSAVNRAAGKGARDSVVLLDDLALLVNVSNRTVLTAIETGRMRDGVFTNIDSVVVG